MSKGIRLPEPIAVASRIGDIAMFDGKPATHTHVNLSDEDGISHGLHPMSLVVGPTTEVIVTVEPTPLYKRLDKEFEAGVIDLSLPR